MLNLYKYSYIIELEKNYRNYFKFASSITLLPPILKKVGVIYYLAFMAIESGNSVKRPIGVVLVNKVTGQEKVYDMSEYEFCPSYPDFEYEYYNLKLSQLYYPNLSLELEENFKVSLDKLAFASSSKFFNIDNNEYQKYLDRIEKLFPSNFFVFFGELQNNEIIPVDEKIKAKRDITKIRHSLNNSTSNKQRLIENTVNKRIYKKRFRKLINQFIKNEILPELKGSGSYNKLVFYYNFGNYYKNFEKNITNYYSCYGIEVDNKTREENLFKSLDKEKQEIKKLFYNNYNTKYFKDVAVDTLGKVLIVFLNSLLVEEIHNSVIKHFEEQINECIDIFNKNDNKEIDFEAEQFLYEVYNELLLDYKTASNENLSNTYYGYLIVNFPFDM